jgi:phosphatidylinositol alpha-mannosyltransferase
MAYKKIGIVTEYYYPLLGGVTENVHNSRVRLKNLDYDVKIITSNCNKVRFPVDEKYDSNDPDIIRIGHSMPIYGNRSFGHLTYGINLMSKVRRMLEAEKFDLLHIHSPIVLTLPAVALLTAKCALVGTFHTYFESSMVYSAFRNRIQMKALDKLDGQIAVSKSCIESLSHYFKMRARIIPNGVDINQFSPDIPRLKKYDDDKLNLLFLGRFDPRNGLTFMLKAFEIIKSHYAKVRLIVVGDGSLSFYYKGRMPKSISQDVCFEGLAKDKRPGYYASCDIFCSPVTKASFGVTLLEAMASGKPIVATENVGYKDLLSQHESFLVSPNDPNAFAEAVLRLLNDKQFRKEMGLNGRKKALAYSWDKIVRDINEYYQEILDGK